MAIVRVVSCLAAAVILLAAGSARAQNRVDVTFQVERTTAFGQSVFLLGDLPELGGGDVRFSVKLEPSTYPVWRATISLPAGRAYTYQYLVRNDAAGQWGTVSNGQTFAGPFSATTPGAAPAANAKTFFFHSSFDSPVLWWRHADAAASSFQSLAMHAVGPGREPGEQRFAARRFGVAGRPVEFYFTDVSGVLRSPPASPSPNTLLSTLDTLLVQDGGAYAYVPAAIVSGPRKRYTTNGATPSTPSTSIFSTAMNETRFFRVITPRGYDQHPEKRYPVLYLHDGQNVFEQGSFGTWNADETAELMVRRGQMREVILVGADHGPNRLNDYAAPDSGGWSNGRYLTFMRSELKPLIDQTYRTLTGPDETGVLGSSMGGQASMWFGWDRPDVYRRLGVFSGAWNVFSSGFYNRVTGQAKRPVRIYVDSGDSGTATDLFWTTVGLRDNLINPLRAGGPAVNGGPYVLERDLRHVYGPGQIHNEGAWASRLPKCYEYLFPASESPNELASLPSARPADVNDDDLQTIEDLYAFEQGTPGPGSTLDVDRDGVFEPTEDRSALLSTLRAGEHAEIGER